jgi:hypothetical protein
MDRAGRGRGYGVCTCWNAAKNGRICRCFRRRSHIPFGTFLPPPLPILPSLLSGISSQRAASPFHPRYFCKTEQLTTPPRARTPSGTHQPSSACWGSSLIHFVHGRAKTGSLRIMAAIYGAYTLFFRGPNALPRPQSPVYHRCSCDGPPIRLLQLASFLADNNPVPPPHIVPRYEVVRSHCRHRRQDRAFIMRRGP